MMAELKEYDLKEYKKLRRGFRLDVPPYFSFPMDVFDPWGDRHCLKVSPEGGVCQRPHKDSKRKDKKEGAEEKGVGRGDVK